MPFLHWLVAFEMCLFVVGDGDASRKSVEAVPDEEVVDGVLASNQSGACCLADSVACLACATGMSEEELCKADPSVPGCARVDSGRSGNDSIVDDHNDTALPGSSLAASVARGGRGRGRSRAVQRSRQRRFRQRRVLWRRRWLRCRCRVATAQCLACGRGVSVTALCRLSPRTAGCPPQLRRFSAVGHPEEEEEICCTTLTASCLACTEEVTTAEFCQRVPEATGCSFGIGGESNEVEHCKQHPQAPGCQVDLASQPAQRCCEEEFASCFACAAGVTTERYCQQQPSAPGCSIDRTLLFP